MKGRNHFSNVKLTKMLRFFSVAEAHGLKIIRLKIAVVKA